MKKTQWLLGKSGIPKYTTYLVLDIITYGDDIIMIATTIIPSSTQYNTIIQLGTGPRGCKRVSG